MTKLITSGLQLEIALPHRKGSSRYSEEELFARFAYLTHLVVEEGLVLAEWESRKIALAEGHPEQLLNQHLIDHPLRLM
jgi:hypothetical protein